MHACVCVYREKWLKKKRVKYLFLKKYKIYKLCTRASYIFIFYVYPMTIPVLSKEYSVTKVKYNLFINTYISHIKWQNIFINMPNLVVDIQTNLAHVNHSIYYSNLVQFLLILYLLGFLYKIL